MSSEHDATRDFAIEVRHLSKCYRLYAEPRDRLRQAVQPRLARMLRRLGIAAAERRYFTEHWALNDVSFEVRRGETVGILGRNGAGKSTLLQMICGTLTPTAGEVRLRGGRVAALLELGSGFNPEFTGRENILLNASVLGLSREETLARMDDILAFADIGDFIDHPVKTYSSGMAMRVAFAVIAHVDADVLVVDEALAVGDAFFQQKCLRWLRQFQQRGTVLFCGHDLGAVMQLCQRAIWIDKGRVRMAGTARDVAEVYANFTHALSQGLPEDAVQVATTLSVDDVVEEVSAPLPAPASDEKHSDVEADIIPSPHAGLRFDGNAFGAGQARIIGVELRDAGGHPTALVKGGQMVTLVVQARAEADLADLILGFMMKDRLGQVIFVQNTLRSRVLENVQAPTGAIIEARFSFRVPLLTRGDYGLGAAIACGTQDVHIMQHFLHEVLVIHVETPGHLGGLLTVPLVETQATVRAATAA